MSDRSTSWYRLGYALERVRGTVRDPSTLPRDPNVGRLVKVAALAAAGTVTLKLALAGSDEEGTRGASRWLRGIVAGGAAALTGAIFRRLTEGGGEDPSTLPRELLDGAGEGLLYAYLLAPRLPGPRPIRGTVYGTADYLAAPWGGVSGLLRQAVGRKRLPFLADFLDGGGREPGRLIDHLVFGIALALLYGDPE